MVMIQWNGSWVWAKAVGLSVMAGDHRVAFQQQLLERRQHLVAAQAAGAVFGKALQLDGDVTRHAAA